MRKFLTLFLCQLAILTSFSQTIEPSGPLSFCDGGSVTLKALSTGTATYQWKKDGTNISGANSQEFKAESSGSYTVSVNGIDYAAVVVTEKPNPVSKFTFTPNNQCAETPISFTNTSTGTGLTYSWSFGDPNSGTENTSTSINPKHSFIGINGSGSENFTVKLTAKGSNGCSNDYTATITSKQIPDAQLGGEEFDIVDGKPYFKVCNSVASTLTFKNLSTTQSINTNYLIDWGDGTSEFSAATFSSISHTYSVGPHTLTFTVTGSNGCKKTSTYYVFVGSNPAVGLSNPGNTVICSGTSLTFPISNTTNNPPGTIYTINFNDGSSAETFTHPAPSNVTHTFEIGSCGTTSGGFSNSFSASIQATNPCGVSAATVVPIYVSQKPKASFTITPKETVCANSVVTFTNTSINGSNINSSGTCSDGKLVWSISPATGWSINNGILGNDNGLNNPVQWNPSGSNTLGVRFTSAGTYTIKLKVGGNSLCGSDFIEKTICVNPIPEAAFDLDKMAGCGPLTVKATNKSNVSNCGVNTYKWTVDYTNAQGCTPNISGYTFINSTNSTSTNPEFQFTNPGVYTISLVTYNSDGTCISTSVSKQVTVKAKPNVSLPATATICQNASVSPIATINNCYSSTAASYKWSFPGGIPTSSTDAIPGAITYNTAGTHTITLEVTNECGTTTVTQSVTVKPSPNVSVPANLNLCAGNASGNLSFSSSIVGTTFSWINDKSSIGLSSSGTGSINSFIANNNTSSPIVATIAVSPSYNGCTGPSTPFTITVNPIPLPPSVTSPLAYCQGESATALNATASTGNTLVWYTSALGGTGNASAPTPTTTSPGNTTYYVSQRNAAGCESTRSAITVNVTATPTISGTKADAITCGSSTGAITISGLQSGTSYTVSFTKSGIVTTRNLTANSGSIIIDKLSSGTYTDIFVKTNNCSTNKIGPFTISDPNPPATPVPTSNGPICSGQELKLNITTPVTGVTYTWTAPDGITSNATTFVRSNATTAYGGIYSVTATKDGCTSPAGTINVVINQTPILPVVTSNSPICTGSTLTLNASSTTAGVVYSWTGPNSFASTDQNISIANAAVSASGDYKVKATLGSCFSENTKAILVNPTPSISNVTPNNAQTCGTANGSLVLSGLTSTKSYIVHYSKGGLVQPSKTLIADGSGNITITGLSSGTYNDIYVTLDGCASGKKGPFTISDPNPPAVPVITNISPICSGNALNLSVTSPISGVTYNWTGPNGYSNNGASVIINNALVINSGIYNVTATKDGCTSAAGTISVTINQTPNIPTVNSNSPVCSGGTINLTANSSTPGTIGYTWTGPGTYASSDQNPNIINANTTHSGTYAVRATLGSCTSAAGTTIVTVNETPSISEVSKEDPSACNTPTGKIYIKGLAANTTYTITYKKDGTSVSPFDVKADASGIITLFNLKAGDYSAISVVLNNCSSNLAGPLILSDPNPPSAPKLDSNSPICSENALKLTAQTSETGASFTWTGPNGFTSNEQNPEILKATTAASGTYTSVITVKGCTASATVDVTVNPKPAPPSITPHSPYCLNGTATALVATASAGNSLNWYAKDGTTLGTTAPIPSTTTAGTFEYFVTQKTPAGCESDKAVISIIIYPAITGNSIGDDQTLCAGKTPNQLSGKPGLSGGNGSYTYQWQSSTNGTDWNNIPGATNEFYAMGAVMSTTKYRRLVNSNSCTTNASNVITITTQAGLTNYEISAPQTICAGITPEKLTGQQPIGGSGNYTFEWLTSSDNITWTTIAGADGIDYQPASLNATTYYQRKVLGGACEVFSTPVKITVNERPIITPITDALYCQGTSVAGFTIVGAPLSGVTYSWVNDNAAIGLSTSGTNTIPAFTAINASDPKEPVIATIEITPTYTNNGVSCIGSAEKYSITIVPTVTIKPIADEVVCTGTSIAPKTLIHDAKVIAGATITYRRTVTGDGINLTNGTDANLPGYIASNDGSADKVATITITPVFTYGGKACDGTPITYTVTVKPKTPNAAAGPDVTLCAATSYTMKATAAPGTTGKWEQVSGPTTTIVDPTSPTSEITGLKEGNIYRYKWTVTGFANCPPTSAEIQVTVLSALTNNINVTGKTVCFGQTVQIKGDDAIGGTGVYVYQWQMSTNGSSWVDIPSQTGVNLTFAPSQSVTVRRVVTSMPCTSISATVSITVQAPVGNNIISGDKEICINNDAPALKGSSPTGADGSFLYIWQQSINGTTWTDIPGATSQDYDPPILTVTTQYRRIVATNLCTGPQSSISNVLTITVNPDAQADFTYTKDLDCAPFVLTNKVIVLKEFLDRNKEYQWYVNGTIIGTGTNFPGYTIDKSGTSVTVKLKAISRYGCQDDILEHTFATVVDPEPAYTQSATVGCGPLTVTFNNTTPNASLFTYVWDFGNGQTSNAIQPGAITFASNPTFGDTTYIISLKAISQCRTVTTTSSVLVKSKPKALFTPSKTIGCSPMTVEFTNTSLGIGNTYKWDFGDGTVVTASKKEPISHTFHTAERDTFYVRLTATNECGDDVQEYAIVVTPNTIRLDFAVNGNEHLGCAPHPVRFINNTIGATSFRWDFGDGNILSTNKNIDTVTHSYLTPGTYLVQLLATNGCSDTATTESITVYSKPVPAYTVDKHTVCIGDQLQFTNSSTDATSYLWKFGDGNVSTVVNPTHRYTKAGTYNVVLIAYRTSAPGVVCTDSVLHQVNVLSSMPGNFDASSLVGTCIPFTVTFTNKHQPSMVTMWDFGDGKTTTGDVVTHTYTKPGSYSVSMLATVPQGCTYIATKVVQANGPYGELNYKGGVVCNNEATRFEATIVNTDKLVWNFGDGTTLTTTDRIVFHTYEHAGKFVPSVTLQSNTGCSYPIKGIDTLFVDKIKAGYQFTENKVCGTTTVHFKDTSHVYFGKKSITWDFGDGTTTTGPNPVHTYTASGTYPVQMTVTSLSGCVETITRQLNIAVYDKPVVDIVINTKPCTDQAIEFVATIAAIDPITHIQWSLSNGVKGTGNPFKTVFNTPGNYSIQVIVGTVNGCFDTASVNFKVDPSPVITASPDVVLCRGGSTNLSVTGAAQYAWSPINDLSCTTCPNPKASPLTTTPYVVTGTNNFGCSDWDTVIVTVMQPFKMDVSPNDSICIGSSTLLQASGASSYRWSPATGLSSTTISNPIANPTVTTKYRVVGYDGQNCFTDTAFVVVAIGQIPTVDLGPDLVLSTGTLQPLASKVQNGPIRTWEWKPPTDLSCDDCPLPIAHIKKDITYTVKVTTPYGCTDTDTLSIKTFCESAQVFVPNAFTPDADGINDIAMVRGKGIVTVKTFRIFNRWGEVVFEKGNFPPNDPRYGWDGKVKGNIGGPDVYVYTADVICENGTTYTYKGNISIIK